jgi:hypothetical protein
MPADCRADWTAATWAALPSACDLANCAICPFNWVMAAARSSCCDPALAPAPLEEELFWWEEPPKGGAGGPPPGPWRMNETGWLFFCVVARRCGRLVDARALVWRVQPNRAPPLSLCWALAQPSGQNANRGAPYLPSSTRTPPPAPPPRVYPPAPPPPPFPPLAAPRARAFYKSQLKFRCR